jgi:alpha-D-ribose 1-methylphosphonate 5-triphosphate synthase subunit PhnH
MMPPGFADPARDSQAVFRAVLDAMARPGRIHEVTVPTEPNPPLDRATAAVLLTLVDGETPLWMHEHSLALRDWAAFHCGAAITTAAEARFALALEPPSLGDFATGSDEEPEGSATVIMQVESLGEGPRFRLDGPGLEAPAHLAVRGLTERFLAEWRSNGRLFPRGVDVILCAGERLAALPRTVRVEAG